jgi:hypothetical protein
VVAQHLAMIGIEYHDRAISQAGAFQFVEDPADVFVVLADHAVVIGLDSIERLGREGTQVETDTALDRGLLLRRLIGHFTGTGVGGGKLRAEVHLVERCRRIERMVRTPEVDMEEERVLPVGLEELAGMTGKKGGLVDIIGPGHGVRLKGAAPVGRIFQPVGSQELIVFAVAGERLLEASHIGARGKREFADAGGFVALLVQHLGQRDLGFRQNIGVAGDAVNMRIAAGMHADARRNTLRRMDEMVGEADALRCQTVGVGGADDRVPVAAEAIGAVLIVGDDQQVPFLVVCSDGPLKRRSGQGGSEEFAASGHLTSIYQQIISVVCTHDILVSTQTTTNPMAEQRPQNFDNHTRVDPVFHFFLAPVSAGLFFSAVAHAVRHPDFLTIWLAIAGLVLLVALFLIRIYSLRVQDRVIRLEERLRLAAVLPESQRPQIAELTKGQLVALRFASDAEVAALAVRAAQEKLPGKEIKKSIRNWRPDYFRV